MRSMLIKHSIVLSLTYVVGVLNMNSGNELSYVKMRSSKSAKIIWLHKSHLSFCNAVIGVYVLSSTT